MACFRDVTRSPLLLLSVPRLRRRIALSRERDAASPYFVPVFARARFASLVDVRVDEEERFLARVSGLLLRVLAICSLLTKVSRTTLQQHCAHTPFLYGKNFILTARVIV